MQAKPLALRWCAIAHDRCVMKLALVTGGFRRLGAAIAARLASDGWTLALHCREVAEPDHELAAILALHKTEWQGFSCDLADGVAVSGLLERVVRHFGTSPELIVNNASRFSADDATSLTPGELSAHMAVNLSAPVLLATGMAALLDMGKTGVELSYEETLHGTAGAEEIEVSAGGRTVRSLSRRPASAGANLILSIDMELQRRIEEWFGERRLRGRAPEPFNRVMAWRGRCTA